MALLGQGAFYRSHLRGGGETVGGERTPIHRQAPVPTISLCIPDMVFLFLITKGFQTPELLLLHFSCLIGLGCPYGNFVAALERQQNRFL